jgi:hypothetical protein
VEKSFQRLYGKIIKDDYLSEQLNDLLFQIYSSLIRNFYLGPIVYNFGCDVLRLNITMDVSRAGTVITLHVIIIRPCFANRGLLTIIVYMLLLAAYNRGDVKAVVVEKCVDATANALTRKFGSLVRRTSHVENKQKDAYLAEMVGEVDDIADDMSEPGPEPIEEFTGVLPDYVFTDVQTIMSQLSLKSLNLDQKVWITDNGVPQLIEAGFPTAVQLNDSRWVQTDFTNSQRPVPLTLTQVDEEPIPLIGDELPWIRARIDAEIRRCEMMMNLS